MSRIFGKIFSVLIALLCATGISLAQSYTDWTLNGNVVNNGTIRVRRDIINNTTGMVTVSGTGVVRLDRTVNNHLIRSTTGTYPITFSNLSMTQTMTVTLQVDVTVTNNLTVGDASNPYTNAGTGFSIGSRTLTISNLSSYLTTSTAALTFSGGVVNYNASSGSQSVLAGNTTTTYGTLGLIGNANMTIPDVPAGSVSIATLSHSGTGTLTVNDSTNITTSGSIGTLATVASGKLLKFSGSVASSIATVSANAGTIQNNVNQALNITTVTANAGTIDNANSGLLTITTLSGNSGSINGGAGGATFTNAAANTGTITGGAGLITFSNTLNHGTGTITAGAGGITFSSTVTFASGTIAAGSGAQLTFSGNVSNSGTAVINLTGGGTALFAGTVNTTGLTFPSGSSVTYNGSSAGQVIADVNYGNLTLQNSTKSWTLGAARTVSNNLTLAASSATTAGGSFNLNVGGNVSLASNLIKSANAVAFANAASAVSGAGYEIVGSVSRTHAFVASTAYTFNNATMTVTPTTLGTLSSLTIQSNPSTNPTGYLAGNSVNRQYHVSYTGTGFTATMQLAYLAAEYTGSLASKLKDFNGGIAKANKIGGTYTNGGPTNGFNYVSLPGITTASFASGNEIGVDDRYNVFNSIANTAWNVATTWDANSIPTSNDDVNIISTHTVTIPDAYTASALSVTIDGTTANTLTVGGGASGILNIGVGGLTNNAASGVLTVNTGAQINITGATLLTGGNITNNGTVNVNP